MTETRQKAICTPNYCGGASPQLPPWSIYTPVPLARVRTRLSQIYARRGRLPRFGRFDLYGNKPRSGTCRLLLVSTIVGVAIYEVAYWGTSLKCLLFSELLPPTLKAIYQSCRCYRLLALSSFENMYIRAVIISETVTFLLT